jgi:hypothetical protein
MPLDQRKRLGLASPLRSDLPIWDQHSGRRTPYFADDDLVRQLGWASQLTQSGRGVKRGMPTITELAATSSRTLPDVDRRHMRIPMRLCPACPACDWVP